MCSRALALGLSWLPYPSLRCAPTYFVCARRFVCHARVSLRNGLCVTRVPFSAILSRRVEARRFSPIVLLVYKELVTQHCDPHPLKHGHVLWESRHKRGTIPTYRGSFLFVPGWVAVCWLSQPKKKSSALAPRSCSTGSTPNFFFLSSYVWDGEKRRNHRATH